MPAPAAGQNNVTFNASNRATAFPGQNLQYPGQAGNEAGAMGTTASNEIGQAGNAATQIGQQGSENYSVYNNALNSYLRQYASAAGVNSGLQPQATFDNGVSGSVQPNTGQSPFTLTPNENQYVTSQVDSLGQAKSNALANYESQLSNSGQLSPAMRAEGAAVIGQHFDDLLNQTQSGAQLQQQQEIEQNLGSLMNLAGSQSQQGAAMENQAGSLENQTAGEATGAAGLWSGVAQQDAATNPLGAALGFLGNLIPAAASGQIFPNAFTQSGSDLSGWTGVNNGNGTYGPAAPTATKGVAANTATGPDATQLAIMQQLAQQGVDFSALMGGQGGQYDLGV